jgi:hypothetical protein
MRRFLAVPCAVAFAVAAVSRAPLAAQAPRALSDSAFAQLVAVLSEAGGFFDTDNLISNEDAYLHPTSTLKRIGIMGGVYLGVGPDQNLSYIANVRPHIAFIVDIRRDNLLEHLLFKSLFALARNRLEYLCLLFGEPAPADTTGWGARDIESLLHYVDSLRPNTTARERILARVLARAERSPLGLSPADLGTIGRFHLTFISQGLGLRFNSFNRAPQPYYPDYRRLLLETDRNGRKANFLANETDFRFVKALEDNNLVVPVVGDFAGTKALPAIAQWIRGHGETVSVFYTSNVEQYLFQGGSFARFAQSVSQLPRDEGSVIVRSYFGRGHPQAVAGYYTVLTVQLMDRFATVQAAGGFSSFYDLTTREILKP